MHQYQLVLDRFQIVFVRILRLCLVHNEKHFHRTHVPESLLSQVQFNPHFFLLGPCRSTTACAPLSIRVHSSFRRDISYHYTPTSFALWTSIKKLQFARSFFEFQFTCFICFREGVHYPKENTFKNKVFSFG